MYHHVEDGIILFFLNIGIHQPDCTVLHLRRVILVLRLSHASFTSERWAVHTDFPRVLSVNRFHDDTSNYARIASFDILSKQLFTLSLLSLGSIQSDLRKVPLNIPRIFIFPRWMHCVSSYIISVSCILILSSWLPPHPQSDVNLLSLIVKLSSVHFVCSQIIVSESILKTSLQYLLKQRMRVYTMMVPANARKYRVYAKEWCGFRS